jgi:hypothetical protein
MSDVRTLVWNLLSFNANLPDELIVKILYEFNGLSHPLVSILLNETKIKYYEDLQSLPFSKIVQNHYYKYGYNLDLKNIMINKHKFFKIHNNASYINFNDPGYFIPRQNGRLFYSITGKCNTVNVNWNLNRSNKILDKIKCVGCFKNYVYSHEYNSSKASLNKDTYILKELEEQSWICNYCCHVGLDNLSYT